MVRIVLNDKQFSVSRGSIWYDKWQSSKSHKLIRYDKWKWYRTIIIYFEFTEYFVDVKKNVTESDILTSLIKTNIIWFILPLSRLNVTFQIFLCLPQIEPLHPDPGSIWVNADQGSLDLAPQVLASFHLSNSGRIRDICGYFHPSSCHELISNCCDWVEQVIVSNRLVVSHR